MSRVGELLLDKQEKKYSLQQQLLEQTCSVLEDHLLGCKCNEIREEIERLSI